ncbi:hypothetical protein CA13_28850 [Planctomycetes bacterium CA13]|uniref:CARDB domain-containing protein n=1 Tax=Novipirellula herctigrandis TaxID=2527986 RepID=A0A5C5Z224_9BACT|nr:hypothetical protein CA13_28850 [Planctomycetes bacterium CA13]
MVIPASGQIRSGQVRSGQVTQRERPAAWKNLVPGGQFKDFILPTHVHFAVIDCRKHNDQPADTHNSKLIILPMRKARLLDRLSPEPITSTTGEIQVKIRAKDGFDPHRDLDLDSLRFGASDEVNYGRGSKLLRAEKAGKHLVLVFGGSDCGFTAENFAGKLLGKHASGELLFGSSDLPGADGKVPLLSAMSPKFEFTGDGLEAYVEVTNFGELMSDKSVIKMLIGDELLAEETVRSLNPFENSMVRLVCQQELSAGSAVDVTVLLQSGNLPTESFKKKVVVPRK